MSFLAFVVDNGVGTLGAFRAMQLACVQMAEIRPMVEVGWLVGRTEAVDRESVGWGTQLVASPEGLEAVTMWREMMGDSCTD